MAAAPSCGNHGLGKGCAGGVSSSFRLALQVPVVFRIWCPFHWEGGRTERTALVHSRSSEHSQTITEGDEVALLLFPSKTHLQLAECSFRR